MLLPYSVFLPPSPLTYNSLLIVRDGVLGMRLVVRGIKNYSLCTGTVGTGNRIEVFLSDIYRHVIHKFCNILVTVTSYKSLKISFHDRGSLP